MKHLQMCYIFDSLAEKIIGKFTAPNKEYAMRVFSDFVNEPKNVVHDDVHLLLSNVYYDDFETFEDVMNNVVGAKVVTVAEVIKHVNNSDSDSKN